MAKLRSNRKNKPRIFFSKIREKPPHQSQDPPLLKAASATR